MRFMNGTTLFAEQKRYIILKSKRSQAVFEVADTPRLISCENRDRCLIAGVGGNECPRYCEFMVALRDYLKGIRKPKMQVEEITYQ
ncbi:hypothetical protein Asulf_00620 [Archaeoglobus sulfaticallidus PM70-1]|uniref:Uncharacterized protein n=1 Tax=Archaeoglobus sulfaticallidus PM70-1 TaxID=387631 RepID=N0BAK1_9EURY|nr:hypothetical protein [Archaeoglobus sulfaticallidus]AGK60639.1 hypothetical protein Asulf_00620 [Archaeoglobus sulfaticallidus PM70-1]